jgi:hypothetical protein
MLVYLLEVRRTFPCLFPSGEEFLRFSGLDRSFVVKSLLLRGILNFFWSA